MATYQLLRGQLFVSFPNTVLKHSKKIMTTGHWAHLENIFNTIINYHIWSFCNQKVPKCVIKMITIFKDFETINDHMWLQNLQKEPKMTYILTYFSLNIGHSDLIFGRLIYIFNTSNNYHIQRFCNQKGQNVASKSSKSTKNDLFLTYISQSIDRVDLLLEFQ